jgi:predicted short-subunit dehydrogenase-like oxidoreductase (DUF2520 family)
MLLYMDAVSATQPSLPLAGLTFSLVGPGRVGTSLAAWLEASGARGTEKAPRRDLPGLSTEGQDLLLIAVPDPALEEVAAVLARRPQAAVALHTSGSLDASALFPLRERGSAVGSLHPLKAFPRPLEDPGQAKGVFFAIDGDPLAQALAQRLVVAWGGTSAEVASETRALYHFAATLAAGGVVTLLALVEELADRVSLPEAAVRGYLELCRGAVAQVLDSGSAVTSLTGPTARGDRETVVRQLNALGLLAPEKLPLVRQLARETLRQKKRKEPLTRAQQELLAFLDTAG